VRTRSCNIIWEGQRPAGEKLASARVRRPLRVGKVVQLSPWDFVDGGRWTFLPSQDPCNKMSRAHAEVRPLTLIVRRGSQRSPRPDGHWRLYLGTSFHGGERLRQEVLRPVGGGGEDVRTRVLDHRKEIGRQSEDRDVDRLMQGPCKRLRLCEAPTERRRVGAIAVMAVLCGRARLRAHRRGLPCFELGAGGRDVVLHE